MEITKFTFGLKKFFSFFKFIKSPIFTGLWFCSFNFLYIWLAFLACSIFFIDFADNSNLSFAFTINLNLLIPVFSFILYFKNKTYRSFKKVYRLFFGLELPLIALCVLRLFLLREITPFFFAFLLTVGVVIFCQIVDYLNIKKIKKLPRASYFMALGYETAMIIGIYIFILSLFYIVPIAFTFIKFIVSFEWVVWIIDLIKDTFELFVNFKEFLAELPVLIMGLIFAIFFGSMFVFFCILPFLSLSIYIKSFLKYTKKIANKRVLFAFAVLYFCLMALFSIQPDASKITKDIDEFKKASSYEQKIDIAKKTIYKNDSKYKKALLEKYTAKFKYFADIDYNGLSYHYNNKIVAKTLQSWFNNLAYPFIYRGKYGSFEANIDYEELFDENIQSAQREKIKKSLESTIFQKELAATLLDKDSKNVLLLNRKIAITTKKDSPIAHVSIIEQYKNKTKTPQEVYYEFSLPEGSVVDNLILGANLEYKGVISPKGAARKTYETQIAYRRDPALLEKAGLKQYTLRVFPVEVKDRQKVCFEYLTYIQDGKIGLPLFFEKRNVFENAGTKITYSVNKESFGEIDDKNFIKLENKINYPLYTKVDDSYYVLDKIDSDNTKLKGAKIAFLLDTSYSNKTNWKKYLKNDEIYSELLDDNEIDIYFFNDFLSKKVDIETIEQINIGKTKKINAINSLKSGYDLVVLFTDGSAFDSSKKEISNIKTPLYIIHTTKEIPPYFNELTKTIIKTKGDTKDNLKEVIRDYSLKKNPTVLAVDKDYILYKLNAPKGKPLFDKYFNKLIMSKVIKEKIAVGDTSDIKILEDIHGIAQKEGIVTDYSSYIALVSETQNKLLKHNEKSKDKFEADLKTGTDDFVNSNDNNIKAVPEPQEWAMLILGFVLFLVFVLKRKILCKN